MSEILFVTWDGGGNVPPAIALAAELRRRGHGVRLLGHAANAAAAERGGIPFEPFGSARPFDGTEPHSPAAMISLFADRGLGRDVLDSLARRPADLVVVDCLLFGAMAPLAAHGTPYVVLEHLYDEYLTRRWLPGPLGIGVRLHGLRPRRLLDQAALRLVATLPALDPAGRRTHPANHAFCGPTVTGRPAALDGAAVLVSLSTFRFSGMQEVLQRILDALAELPTRVVVTTGPVVDPAGLRAPGNAEVHRFVPHAELLPAVSLVIGHGGHATTMAALAHDLPLLVMPMHPLLDQPLVGRSVQEAGAGRLLAKRAGVDAIRATATELLAVGPHRVAAARLGATIRGADGAATGASLLEGCLSPTARPR